MGKSRKRNGLPSADRVWWASDEDMLSLNSVRKWSVWVGCALRCFSDRLAFQEYLTVRTWLTAQIDSVIGRRISIEARHLYLKEVCKYNIVDAQTEYLYSCFHLLMIK